MESIARATGAYSAPSTGRAYGPLFLAVSARGAPCCRRAGPSSSRFRLSILLQAHLRELVSACAFATVAGALTAHMDEAQRRGWALPRQLYGPDFAPATAGAEGGAAGELLLGRSEHMLLGRTCPQHTAQSKACVLRALSTARTAEHV